MQLGRMVRLGMSMGVEGWLWVLVRSLGWLIVGAVTAVEGVMEEVKRWERWMGTLWVRIRREGKQRRVSWAKDWEGWTWEGQVEGQKEEVGEDVAVAVNLTTKRRLTSGGARYGILASPKARVKSGSLGWDRMGDGGQHGMRQRD